VTYIDHKNMTKMVFQSIEQRDGQIAVLAGAKLEIDKVNPLVVWIKYI
jgi:hypothetical protein